jgi:hypothetical protein
LPWWGKGEEREHGLHKCPAAAFLAASRTSAGGRSGDDEVVGWRGVGGARGTCALPESPRGSDMGRGGQAHLFWGVDLTVCTIIIN